MGLATPTSIMVGTGRAQLGVLLRKGEALQQLKTTRVVAVDKASTLTLGRPVLTDLALAPGFTRAPVLAAIAAVEAQSEHPITRAIVQAAEGEGLALPTVAQFENLSGMGVRAQVEGHNGGQRIEIGADRFMHQLGLNVAPFAQAAAQLGQEGKAALRRHQRPTGRHAGRGRPDQARHPGRHCRAAPAGAEGGHDYRRQPPHRPGHCPPAGH